MLLSDGGQGPHGKERKPKAHFSWREHVLRRTEPEFNFKLRYCLDFDAFMELLAILRPQGHIYR